MEPVNLDSSPGDSEADARLEAFLRVPHPPLPDAGFSTRVLAALPPRPSTSTASARWSRTTLGAITALVSTLAALAAFALWSDWNASWAPVITAFDSLTNRFADPMVLASLVIAIASSFYALRRPTRRVTGLVRLN